MQRSDSSFRTRIRRRLWLLSTALSVLLIILWAVTLFVTVWCIHNSSQSSIIFSIRTGDATLFYQQYPGMWSAHQFQQPNTSSLDWNWDRPRWSSMDERVLVPEYRDFSEPADNVWKRGLYIPLWFLSLLFALPWIVTMIRRRFHSYPAGCCTRCGYDLRASTNRCPECGMVPS